MKIVIATPLFPPELGYPARYVSELAEHLVKKEHTVTIVAYGQHSVPLPHTRIVSINKKHILPLRLALFFWSLWKESYFANNIIAEKTLASGLPAVLVGRIRKIPVSVHFPHSETWERMCYTKKETPISEALFCVLKKRGFATRLRFALEKATLRLATHIIVSSQKHITLYSTTFQIPEIRFRAIPRPEEREEILPSFLSPYSTNNNVVVIHQQGTPETAYLSLFDAISLLTEKDSTVRVYVIGELPNKEVLLQEIQHNGIEEQVHLKGFISRAERWHIIQQAKALLFITKSTEQTDILSTYKKTNIPIIAPKGSYGEEYAPAHTRWLSFTEGDYSSLTEALIQVLSEKPTPIHKKEEDIFSFEAHAQTLLTP